jgi:hypothetical protein
VLVKALARAWRWQKLLDKGVYGSVTEIAEAEKISKSYVSRILRLALLAPDIVEAILGGWADQRVRPARLEQPLPMGWEGQRGTSIGAAGYQVDCMGRPGTWRGDGTNRDRNGVYQPRHVRRP